jgi:hypothetical protein
VIVTSNRHRLVISKKGSEQFSYTRFNCSGISFAELRLENMTANLLVRRHATLATQWAIGVIEKVARRNVDRHVMVERKVLTPLEGLKAIDGDLVGHDPFKFRRLQEQAMTAQARDVVRDGGGAT